MSAQPTGSHGGQFDLSGRCAAVTGAGRGIGAAVAEALAVAGADLVLLGRPGSNEATAQRLRDLGAKVDVVEVDLADREAVGRLAPRLAAERQVDVLVNNAGTIDRTDSVDVTPQQWDHVLDVNLSSLFVLTQHLGRAMVQRGHGKVVSIASLLSFQGGVRVAAYTASKHAVAGLTKALANEWGPHGVQVNAVAPGYIATDNTQALREDPDRAAQILGRIPAGRWGRASDLAGAAVFLSSSASDYVNGHVLVVDGGWLAR